MLTGLRTARWPCRWNASSTPPSSSTSRTTRGIRQLVRQLPQCAAILAVSSDKNAAEMVRHLATVAEPLILTQFTGHRALPVEQLCAAAGSVAYHRADRIEDAIRLGMRAATADRPLVITGSVYTSGQARALLVEQYNARPLQF